MTTSKTNALSYIQAAISLLLILYSFFYSIFMSNYSLQYAAYYLPLVDIYIILMVNIINIFIQAHGSCKIASIISAIFVLLKMMPELLYRVFDDRSTYDQLPIIIYPMLLLLMVQLILPTILLIVENAKRENRTDITV